MSQLRILDQVPSRELMTSGHLACPGCAAPLAMRLVLKALGPKTIVVMPASCFTIIAGPWPQSSLQVPLYHTAFETGAALASGVRAALDMKGDRETTVLVWAGDGGTFDIGLQALSGAAERNENFLYCCYDNEAYMNTGTQRSGSTPATARTTTTTRGKRENPKDMPRIMEAHGIPYVASTSAVYPDDVYDKLVKARGLKGLRYVHMSTPCPSGWGFDPKDSVRLGQLAVDAGLVVLYEVEGGAFRLTGRSKTLAKRASRKPVAEYLAGQARFKGISADDAAGVQAWVDRRWAELVARDAAGAAAA